MPNQVQKPDSPWRLNRTRIVMLVLGALALVYTTSVLLGGLGNYQLLKEAASDIAAEAPAKP